MRVFRIALGALLAMSADALPGAMNSSYTNPMLPGWHSDPSCTYVAEDFNTFFCITSTFLVFPGIPVYASKDLMHWRLASNAFSRPSQVPWLADNTNQQGGIYAANIRYHEGKFYVTTVTLNSSPGAPGIVGLIFTTDDPFNDAAWSEPLNFNITHIDPDLFWDDDGQTYIAASDGALATMDLATGELGPEQKVWNGTGGTYPEGPHIYKKDGFYYWMQAEGGTELGHRVTIARAKNIWGPYTSYADNPILTNANTTEYFQTVGHADLFQAGDGYWWGVALATRSGPQWENYPMGRETVLFPVTWEEGEWPVLQPVRGGMSGWPLPDAGYDTPGEGAFVYQPDVFDFAPDTAIPSHLVYWRFPTVGNYNVSPSDHPNTLQLLPSKANLTSSENIEVSDGPTLIMRRQTDTRFTYSVEVSFDPSEEGEETGVTAFLTQQQHIDLGVVLLPSTSQSASGDEAELQPHLRFRVTAPQTNDTTLPTTVIKPVPSSWSGSPIKLQVQALNETHFEFSAAPSANPGQLDVLGTAPSTILSGGTGPFTGTLVGVYATSNGGSGSTPSYISNWRYYGQGQLIGNDIWVVTTPF